MTDIVIRDLAYGDVQSVVHAYTDIGWHKSEDLLESYIRQQSSGARDALIALLNERFAGYLTIVWVSDYEPFRCRNIPEVNDFSVLPEFRRKGVGSRLMDAAEQRISDRSSTAGIGVGMDSDYGPAQRMYTSRGYVADGRGLMSHGTPVAYGQTVTVDDDLVLYFTRSLSD